MMMLPVRVRSLAVPVMALGFALSLTALAQEATPVASPAPEEGLVFPVAELGSCADMGSCLTYCEDPVNHASCVAYAKDKGFYEDDPVYSGTDEFWGGAQDTLGCNSRETCEDFCAQEANETACHEFARAQAIPGGFRVDPAKEAVIEAAKTALDCDSYESCRDKCADPANAVQCTAFAHQVGLRGGEVSEGPGGCTTPESCQLYCTDPNHFGDCAAAVPAGGDAFRGPGGCANQQECRTYCEENPDECRTYEPGSNGVYVPIACPTGQDFGPGGVCTASEAVEEAGACAQAGQFWNGESCSATAPPGVVVAAGTPYFEPREELGGCSSPAACYDYCSANPGQCGGFDPAQLARPPETYHPYVYYTPGGEVKFEPIEALGGCDSPGACYDFCAANAGQCEGFDSSAPRPLNVYAPGTYYTPPVNIPYFTPSEITFYVTPVYYTPPVGGEGYPTPAYYTPGMYSTPAYYTPRDGSYPTPTYYTPGVYYATPSGDYPTPSYTTPRYYTPPRFANYTTPSYYTPPIYVTPFYYTPPPGSTYTTPSYSTPPPYTTPSYYTPTGYLTGREYTSPAYYTPPKGSNYTTPSYASPAYYTPGGYYTPTYYTPFDSNYVTPIYYSPHDSYTTPNYYTPPAGSTYTTPNYPSPSYYSPYYNTPSYPTPPEGSSYTSPSYYSPYYSPASYTTPVSTGSYYYPTPDSSGTGSSYYYPTPTGGTYGTPTGYSYPSPSYPTPSGSYSYPAPSSGSYSYPTPSTSGSYPTPSSSGYSYPAPSSGSYSYPTPSTSGSYPTPSYVTPSYATPAYATPSESYATPSYAYPTPESYATPYGTPESYSTPYGTPESYSSPYEYPTPSEGSVQGARTSGSFFTRLYHLIIGR